LRSWSKHGDEIINLEGFTRLEEHGDRLEARAKAFLHLESYSKLERRGKPINGILLSFQ